MADRSLFRLHRAGDGALWIGSNNGYLARYDGTRVKAFSRQDGVWGGRVAAITEDPDGTLWFAMDPVGAFRFDGRQFVSHTKEEGQLAENGVCSIFRDLQGRHWFTMSRAGGGVTRYDGAIWASMDERDGLADQAVDAVVEGPPGTFWLATSRGLTRYQPGTTPPRSPRITVQIAGASYTEPAHLPPITAAERVTFELAVTDFKSRPDNRLFRFRVTPGHTAAATDSGPRSEQRESGWSAGIRNSKVEWSTNQPGVYTFEFQFIDRDLNYSKPTPLTLTVVPPWFLDAKIMGPIALANAALLAWAIVARSLYVRKRREAQRLREELLHQEQQARLKLEAKNEELATARDMAERARERADEASQAKSQFLASVSHELRTPLNAIIGYSEMLAEEAPDMGAQRMVPDLEKIHAAARHQLGLINDILDLSKIEAGKMTLCIEAVDIPRLVDDVVATVQPLVAKNSNRLEVDCPASLGRIRSDPTKLRQVLLNLLSNASKFTEKGTIRLEARRTRIDPATAPGPSAPDSDSSPLRAMLVLTVSDTGIGMSADQLTRLFQPFTQADASTARKYGGTGLGLALSRRFCQLMGGELTAASDFGKGSRFTVTVPDVAPPAEAG